MPTDLKLLGNSFAEPVSLIHHTAGLESQRMVGAQLTPPISGESITVAKNNART